MPLLSLRNHRTALTVLFTTKGVGIVMRTSCLFLVDPSFWGQRLTHRQSDALSSLSLHSDLWEARQVLSHVQYKGSGLSFGSICHSNSSLYVIAFHDLDGFSYLTT